MEQDADSPVPAREFYKTPRPHPWRPILGYEVVEVSPLPAQPITNLLVDAYRTSRGLAIEPLKFPNLVTGFDRNPSHAARAALYTRYTPCDWIHNEIKLYNEANTNRCYSEKLRKNNACLMREADEKVKKGQTESGRKLGERITDVTFWRNEVASELDRLIVENSKMQDSRRKLQIVIQDLEGQLHIAQECLYHRESRKGIDLVHDEVEKALLEEVEIVRNCEKKLKQIMDRCINQLTTGRAVQHQLQIDVQNKETALGIDNVCHQMNNFTRGLQYYDGIERYDPSVTGPEFWEEVANSIVKKSQTERAKSHQLRNDIDNVINAVVYEICEAWTETNKALDRRIAEMLEAKENLQTHLHKIQEEIFDVEKSIVLMQKTIADKSPVLKVAYTRLEARTHRPDNELCKDDAQLRMNREVQDINKIVYDLNMKLQQSEAQHQQLLRTRSNLESNLKSKIDALFIDREKCLGLRRSCPISSIVKY
ncbi:PREDICTED: tektin-3-like [Cyphomyrmex costatus]|uniref:Tektin n=1 Tax=Cyphomyrmex costatus TaxID=456900 RepID=A0A151IKC5_9HYME|nr:PREDICTED: tektin-3-like [Cyphomyrmex costatus]XP_018393331.1 PREDICTED: tektin-3-like [Cyphomyrmex costatus]KYN04709.1 Tektin-3 [Cyphomyrmex costatus]